MTGRRTRLSWGKPISYQATQAGLLFDWQRQVQSKATPPCAGRARANRQAYPECHSGGPRQGSGFGEELHGRILELARGHGAHVVTAEDHDQPSARNLGRKLSRVVGDLVAFADGKHGRRRDGGQASRIKSWAVTQALHARRQSLEVVGRARGCEPLERKGGWTFGLASTQRPRALLRFLDRSTWPKASEHLA